MHTSDRITSRPQSCIDFITFMLGVTTPVIFLLPLVREKKKRKGVAKSIKKKGGGGKLEVVS